MNSLGERIRDARVSLGLSQQTLAEGLASKAFISQVERNKLNPSLPRLRLLADRLGRPLSYFLSEAPPQDSALIRKTAELAIRAREPLRALEVLQETDELGLTANDRADLYRLKGIALIALGRLGPALVVLQEAAATAPIDDPDMNALVYAEIGVVLGLQEQFNGAVEADRRALNWLDRSRNGDADLRARVLTNLARDSYNLGQMDEAIGHLEEALVAATDAESLLRMANAHMALGITARAAGRLDEAMRHCDRALELHRRIGQWQVANHILSNLGDVHYAAGRIGEARDYQTRCLEKAREAKDAVAIGAAASELARYAVARGDAAAAIRFAHESQQAASASNDHLRLAMSLAYEGQAMEADGHPATADRRFRRAIELLAERGARAKLADVCAMYSDVLRDRGQLKQALRYMRMAYQRDLTPAEVRARQ